MPAILNYLIHLLLAAVLLAVFFKAYTSWTPFDEVLLIRQGNLAAALSLGGALIGSDAAMADGRHALEKLLLRFWAFLDGSTQELLDPYYLSITLSAQKML